VWLTWQRRDHVRVCHVSLPAHAIVGGLASPHPVAGGVNTWRATRALASVIPHREEAPIYIHGEVRLPLCGGRRVRVQLQWRAEGHAAVCGSDVIHVTRIGAGAMLRIDVVNDVIKSGRLAPAHVSPVTAEHTSEVTVITAKPTARASKRRSGIGECPSGPAVGRAINHIGAVAEATTHFIHARYVNVACKQIASDLNVSDGAGP